MHIHILGICGTLMGSIALLAKQAGHQVSGSDQNVYPPMSTQLEQSGIELDSPYSSDSIPPDVDLVIVGNAGLPRGNPAVEALLNQRLPYVSGAEWLGRHLLNDRWVIAVSGTHGKTTTTSMIAWIIDYAGLEPGYLIGGIPANLESSARIGSNPFFVIEADEYDTSYFDHQSKFLHYRPQTLVINNLEYDHADIFDDLSQIQEQFHLLIRKIPGNGQIIHPSDDPNVLQVLEKGCWSPQLTFGLSGAELTASDISPDGSEFDVRLGGSRVGHIKWAHSGIHNISNALAALAAARHAGVKLDTGCDALSDFTGVKRRMENIYQDDSLTIYDDFAHHPTAIKSTLEGLRVRIGSDTLLAIIDPASHTMRLGTHADVLGDAITAADQVFWHQAGDLKWDITEYLNDTNLDVLSDLDGLISHTRKYIDTHRPLHVVIMSNGGFGGFHQKLIEAL
ncbi:MAG TPA: UDP-N-acetylmuramate:L-alanyl-gamma-D-glutamyl-meso-diaminopimelate ligase [Gammaproteobacteria bacterium]|nr:UDP-N-acetylmuramate:L-alanyl-gamma-D-glutamyl-meso-diaminopimelate ligase [Gammaproteobacteria bacterium]